MGRERTEWWEEREGVAGARRGRASREGKYCLVRQVASILIVLYSGWVCLVAALTRLSNLLLRNSRLLCFIDSNKSDPPQTALNSWWFQVCPMCGWVTCVDFALYNVAAKSRNYSGRLLWSQAPHFEIQNKLRGCFNSIIDLFWVNVYLPSTVRFCGTFSAHFVPAQKGNFNDGFPGIPSWSGKSSARRFCLGNVIFKSKSTTTLPSS